MSAGTVMSADALRGYIRALRQGRKVTQPKLAEVVNMAVRSYKDWELGATHDIDAPSLLRAMQFLRGSFDDLLKLSADATKDDGKALAEERLQRHEVVAELAPTPSETPEESDRINRLLALLASGVPAQEAAQIVQREQ